MCIEKQKNIVRTLRQQLYQEEQKLQRLYNEEARKNCPFKVGDTVEYNKGMFGEITLIYHQSDIHCPIELIEDQDPKGWAIDGKKINKNNKRGKLNFGPLSVYTHSINGNVFKRKMWNEVLNMD